MKNENRRAEGEQRTRRATEVARKNAIPRKSRRLACQIDHTRRFLYGRGVGKRGRTHPGGKLTKTRAPKIHINRRNSVISGGGQGWTVLSPPPVNPSPKILYCGSVSCVRVGRFLMIFLSAGVAKSPINSKQFELIRLEFL